MNKPKEFKLFIDNEKYEWDSPTITGAQLRTLAGIPQDVQIFQHMPGKPDQEIKNDTIVNLSKNGNERFSTQAPGSSAG